MYRHARSTRRLRTVLLLAVAALAPLSVARAASDADAVTLQEDETSFTLSNGIVTARVLKSNGDIRSMTYKGEELFTDRSGHAGGYWSHDTTGGKEVVTRVTIDPATNGGARAEVSVKGISGGIGMGHGPGAEADGDIPADVEIRYCLGRGEPGIYTYCQFEHLPSYPADQMTEARFACKLAAMFDWLSVDEYRNKHYPNSEPGEDKYVYTALQYENRAFGFSSTTQKIGWWMINPSVEYLSGGPTKPEFLCHRDTTAVQAPVVLNYWRSSHYGGADVTVAAGEHWTKVIGPTFLYVNEGGEPLELWRDARAQADREAAKWPYDWVAGVDYPNASERSVVSGRIVLNDPLMPGGAAFSGKLMIGLAHAPYAVSVANRFERTISWQTDAKHYQFWVEGRQDGRFSIPEVRPGTYTLYALADGVLGEFVKPDVTVAPGGHVVDLGQLEWTPTRRGRPLWEVGVANRSAKEFKGGDRFFEPDAQLKYAGLFPYDVNFIIGQSKASEDWYFQHIPHNTDGNARIAPFRDVVGQGRATPYTVTFDMPAPVRGKATLRLAICGTGARTLGVSVSGKAAGEIALAMGDGVITRHQVQGIWYERELGFDASLLQAGRNTLTLTVPAGSLNDGVVYDYVRLELDEASQAEQAPAPVSLSETADLYTLDNGIVRTQVAKASGDLVSLRYQGKEMFATFLTADGEPDLQRDPPGENLNGLNRGMTDHQYGFWSHDAMGQRGSEPAPVAHITIDPKNNGGRRAEVSVKGLSNGTRQMGTGPGAARGDGDFYADVEIRHAMERGESGVYTYCIFEHKPQYPADTITEARFCMKLNDFFDWMLVDVKRNKLYPKDLQENKYNYTTNQYEHPAFGWASTSENVGCFLVNASMEYMSGGPTKVEFLCHRDTNRVAAPCVLNYWRSSHYGGAMVSVAEGEHWTKVIGPMLIYCNSGTDPQDIYRQAQAKQAAESAKWPYDWVAGVDYPRRDERVEVSGRLVLDDPIVDATNLANLRVGLTHPEYDVTILGFGGRQMTRHIDWQTDAKHYQFWTKGQRDDRFNIPNVRPGDYTLYAFADGVLGQFVKTDVAVRAGQSLDLGSLRWQPVRRGRQLWEIGIANRSGKEFFKGDDYFHDGMPLQYARLFPNDITFVIGKSDFARDWYFEHVPHAEDPNARATFFNPGGNGTAAPRSVVFELPDAPHGRATLRLAICGVGTRKIDVTVNGQPVGSVDNLVSDSTLGRNGIAGIWFERELSFDASVMRAGTNTLVLTVPAGGVTNGIIYDYLRLELDSR